MNNVNLQSDNPQDYVITRKRKLYKFAAFRNLSNCFDDSEWIATRNSLLSDGKPLVLEVGAGTAVFLTRLAEQNPNKQYVAIDRKSDRLYTGAKLADDLKLTNVSYLWSNGRNLTRLFNKHSVDNLWITFPDPWPQESNIKHRLTNLAFLRSYHELLRTNGVLEFKTDNLELFDWSVKQFSPKLWRIELVTHNLHADDVAPANAKIMTTYEERYVREGKPINYLRAVAI